MSLVWFKAQGESMIGRIFARAFALLVILGASLGRAETSILGTSAFSNKALAEKNFDGEALFLAGVDAVRAGLRLGAELKIYSRMGWGLEGSYLGVVASETEVGQLRRVALQVPWRFKISERQAWHFFLGWKRWEGQSLIPLGMRLEWNLGFLKFHVEESLLLKAQTPALESVFQCEVPVYESLRMHSFLGLRLSAFSVPHLVDRKFIFLVSGAKF